jgi:hypothetical protein
MPLCLSSAFIPNGKGRSASFTIRATRPSFLPRSPAVRPRARARRRSPTSLSMRGCKRHLRRCNHPMPSSHNRPIQKSENRGWNTRPRLQGDTRRRSLSWRRGNRNLVGSGAAPGGEVNQRACRALNEFRTAIKVQKSRRCVLNGVGSPEKNSSTEEAGISAGPSD